MPAQDCPQASVERAPAALAPAQAAPETRTLLRHSALISGMALLSRLLGLGRDVGMAWLLGGAAAEALIIAIRLPHLVRRLFAEGALSLSLTAALAGHSQAALLTQSIALRLCLFVLPLSGLACLCAAPLVSVLAPASTPAVQEQAVLLLRICLPYAAFVLLATPYMALLHSRQHFFAPACAPVLFNLCLIAFTIAAAYGMGQPSIMLALGLLCGGALQAASQYGAAAYSFSALRQGIERPAPYLWQQAKRLVADMPAGVLGAAAPQLIMLCAMAAASALPAGTVAGLYYAERLLELPLGILSTGLGIASLPALAQWATQGKMQAVAEHCGTALRFALLLTLPAAAGLAAVAEPLVTVLLRHGAFDQAACLATTAALWGYVPALPACALNRVLLAGCNACGQTRFTAGSSLAVCGLGLVGGFLCVQISACPFWLTLCMSLALWLQSFALWWALQHQLQRHGAQLRLPWRRLVPLCLASMATGASAWLCLALGGGLAPLYTLCLAVPCGIVSCVLVLAVCRNEDFYALVHALCRQKTQASGKTQP